MGNIAAMLIMCTAKRPDGTSCAFYAIRGLDRCRIHAGAVPK